MAIDTIIQREAPEIEAYKLGLLEQAKDLTSAPPVGGLPEVQAQGATDLQQQAFADASQLGVGAYQNFINPASLMIQAGGLAPSQAMIDQYMNPYQQAVQDEINRAYDIQQNQAADRAIGANAFGGSRAEIASREVDRNRASALAQSQAQNFLQAQQAAQNQLQRQIEAGTRLGGLGELAQRMDVSGLGVMSQLGEQQRALLQQQLEAQRQTDLQNVMEPMQRLGFYSDILTGAPSTQMQTQISSAPQPSLLNQLLGAGIGGLSLYGGFNRAFG